MAIKATRAGSQSAKRCQAPTYTQDQADLIVRQRLESYRYIAHELRQLLIDLSKTRKLSRQPDCFEVSRQIFLKTLAKSAELDDI